MSLTAFLQPEGSRCFDKLIIGSTPRTVIRSDQNASGRTERTHIQPHRSNLDTENVSVVNRGNSTIFRVNFPWKEYPLGGVSVRVRVIVRLLSCCGCVNTSLDSGADGSWFTSCVLLPIWNTSVSLYESPLLYIVFGRAKGGQLPPARFTYDAKVKLAGKMKNILRESVENVKSPPVCYIHIFLEAQNIQNLN